MDEQRLFWYNEGEDTDYRDCWRENEMKTFFFANNEKIYGFIQV